MKTPKSGRLAPVSVVIPCFRCANSVRSSVASIAAQSNKPAELLLVDDCSGDGTRETLECIAREFGTEWVRVHSLPANGGPSRARNVGWQNASHDYVAFLDADDWWHPRKLEWQLKAFRSDPGLALIAGRMTEHPGTRNPNESASAPRVRVLPKKWWVFSNPIPTSTVVLRRDLPVRFEEGRHRAEDYQLWARIALGGGRCAIIERPVAYRSKAPFGVSGLSGDLSAMQRSCVELIDGWRQQGALSWMEWALARASSETRYRRRQFITWRRLATGSRR